MRQTFISDKVARPANPYSHGVLVSGKQLWVSGQVPNDPTTGKLIEGDFEILAVRVFENTKLIVESAGGSLANTVKVNVYLRDNDDFARMNEIYTRYFPEPRGARTTIHSNLRNTPIEIDVVVAMDNETIVLEPVRARFIRLAALSVKTLSHIARMMSVSQSTTLRDQADGEKGWTPNQVLGHLLDADRTFFRRAQMILTSDYPTLPVFDHEAAVDAGNFNARSASDIVAELASNRESFVSLLSVLTPAQWERAGHHPESGHFSLLNSVMQIATHDALHTEQIMRILAG